jgi:TonB family protein
MLVVRRGASVWTLAMVVVAFGLTTTVLGQASKAQGTVTVGKTKVTIASGMAVGYKAPNGQLISVLLSDKPANAKEFATDTRIGAGESYVAGIFEGAWKSQHAGKKLSGFMFTIGPNGTVTDAKVLRSIPLLDAAALDAVKQWQFTPTLLNGVPVPVIMTVTVNFTLQ